MIIQRARPLNTGVPQRSCVDVKGGESRVTVSSFGLLPSGDAVQLYTLRNINQLSCGIMNYGACVTQLHVPDARGNLADVVLGYDRLGDYLEGTDYVGATLGRVANRVAGARFALNGQEYQLPANDGDNHLHGGIRGFDKVLWTATPSIHGSAAQLGLSYCSRDSEEGYPGALTVLVTYTLTDKNELIIDYWATTDRATPVNLTNHSYFNLAGRGDILNHVLTVAADQFSPLDSAHLPTGQLEPVKGTAIDFSAPVRIGARMEQLVNRPQGFNHNFKLQSGGRELLRAARLWEPQSGRGLELWTNQPALQLYTGDYMRALPAGKSGSTYGPNSGVCLEPQRFPNAVNQSSFPPVILEAGEEYHHRTIWKFFTE